MRPKRHVGNSVATAYRLLGSVAEAEARLIARETEAREADARSRRESLTRFKHLLGRVEPLAAKADLSLKAAERALEEILQMRPDHAEARQNLALLREQQSRAKAA